MNAFGILSRRCSRGSDAVGRSDPIFASLRRPDGIGEHAHAAGCRHTVTYPAVGVVRVCAAVSVSAVVSVDRGGAGASGSCGASAGGAVEEGCGGIWFSCKRSYIGVVEMSDRRGDEVLCWIVAWQAWS